MRALKFLLIFGSVLAGSNSGGVQSRQLPERKPIEFADARPTYCAERNLALDVLTQRTPEDELIIVIARLGDGETSPNLSRRRLYNVRAYWTEFLYPEGRRKPETIILAEGDRVKGYGQLEFYVGGKLVNLIKVSRNADLFVGMCYPEEDSQVRNHIFYPCEIAENKVFHPCRDRAARRRRRP